MGYRARWTIKGSESRSQEFTRGEPDDQIRAAWEELIDVHEGLLRQAGKGKDRTLARMEGRAAYAAKGIVSGPDPRNKGDEKDLVIYSVQDW